MVDHSSSKWQVPDSVEAGVVNSETVWTAKNSALEREKASRKVWEELDEEERQAIIRVVRQALDQFHDTATDWVPSSLSAEPGNYLELTIRVLFTDVVEAVAAQRALTERQIAEAADETARMLRQVRGEPEA